MDYFPVADNPGAIRQALLSMGRYSVKVKPLLVDNLRFRLVNKPACQHERIGARVPLTTIVGAQLDSLR
jgi:hypothetical protein